MGQEVDCTAAWNGKISEGRAWLELDHVLFRGDFRVQILINEIVEARSTDGHLHIRTANTELSLKMGRKSDRWLDTIRNPKTLIEKLEVKNAGRAAVISVTDAVFMSQLRQALMEIDEEPATESDPYNWIFLGVNRPEDLSRLSELRTHLAPSGMIWVIMRKGKDATVKDRDLFPAARNAGMAVVKVAAFSPTHTAQKLVARKAERND